MDRFVDQWLAGRIEAARYMSKEPIRRDFKYWRDAEMLSDTNTLERPFIWRLCLRPRNIELMGDLLVWRPDEKEAPPRDPQPSDIGLLNKFVRLCGKNSSPEEYLRFAREWGVMGLCQHFSPYPHPRLDLDDEKHKPCEYFQTASGQYFEPLAIWREYSLEARAILRVAARFHQDRQGDFEDWKVLNPTLQGPLTRSSKMFLFERIVIAKKIDRWLDRGNLNLRLDWHGAKPSIYVSCNIVGLIGCHLMLAVNRSQGIAICTSCSFPYPPKKRPSPGRGNYCDKCKGKAPSRESQATRRKNSILK